MGFFNFIGPLVCFNLLIIQTTAFPNRAEETFLLKPCPKPCLINFLRVVSAIPCKEM